MHSLKIPGIPPTIVIFTGGRTMLLRRLALFFLVLSFCVLYPGITNASEESSLDRLARKIDELREAGRYKEAIPLAEDALAACEKQFGQEHPATAATLNNLAELCHTMGDYERAKPLYERALKIREKTLGPEHPDTATTINDIAALYHTIGDYRRAEPLYERALKIREKALGPDNTAVATTLNNLAELYKTMGDYKRAEPLYQRALKIREKILGPDHADTATSLNNLALLYHTMGDYERAEPLYQRALGIKEKALGPDHADLALTLNNLAELYRTTGDYNRAEPLYKRALKINENTLGPEHPRTATGLNNLAALYYTMGDFKRAEPLYERALNIKDKILGPDHDATATSLNNLAALYQALGDYKRAEPLYERALKITENSLGPEHADTAQSLNNLAALYQAMGDYKRAATLYDKALKIRERVLGPEHADTAQSLNNLAWLYHTMGDFRRAESLYERALSICEKVLGPDHAATGIILSNFSLLQLDKGDSAKAAMLAQARVRAEEKVCANILSFTSEKQRIAYQKTTHPYDLICTIGLAHNCAQSVLRHKGVVVDSLIEDMKLAAAAGNPPMAALVENLRSAKIRMTKLMLETPKGESDEGLAQAKEERERLVREIEATEGLLARNTTGLGRARRSLDIRVSDVQSALPVDAVLVEYMRYSHYLGKGTWEARYGAVVIMQKGEPVWVPLGKADEIDEIIKKFQRLFGVTGGTRGLVRTEFETSGSEEVTSRALRELCQKVWTPLEAVIPEHVKTLILCPDGSIGFVPFAALLRKDGRFLCERYNVRSVSSGRDLLADAETGRTTGFVLFGNPDFGASISREKTPERGVRGPSPNLSQRDMSSMAFSPLPGTARECALLDSLARSRGYAIIAHTGVDASEPELRSLHSPWVLHIATHGFFLPSGEMAPASAVSRVPGTKWGGDDRAERVVNPMLRSGMALAGANATLALWKRGETPDVESDGLLFAGEVSTLDLKVTWLVVLSACETGLGEVLEGEGIQGLRRGFVQAGAKNLMMTLWPISDDATVRFMEEFYAAACDSKDASKALCQVQRDLLVRLRKEKGLREAVYCAGPFVLTFQGRP
jgi:tetratricopeptide (TPR) repeat protein/CHAT domain-containing protein